MKAHSAIAVDRPLSVGIPAKVLGAVLCAVVVAHALVLQLAGDAIESSGKTITRPFVTRAVAVSVAEPVNVPALAAAVPSARPVATAAPAPKPRKRPTAPPPSATAVSAVSEEKQVLGLAESAQAAPETIAPEEPEKASLAPAIPATPAATPSPEPATVPPAAVATPAPSAAPPPPPPATVALTVPGSVRLLYKSVALVNGVHWNVNGELLWLQDGSSYDARLELSLFGLRKIFSSKGNITGEGLLPTRFGDKFRSSEVAAHFERDKHKVVFSANTPDVPLLPGMQDQLSVFVQLSAMFAGAPAKYPPGTQLSFETIGARHPETWVFEVQGEELLSLPSGAMPTVKLVRPKRGEFERTDELWLAPKLGYLPVRLKFTERNGDFIDQQWRATETP